MKYQITIPKPCHEDWNIMTSTEKGKFCKSCSKEVVDFTNLSNSEIAKKVSKDKNLCGRFKDNQLNTELEVIKKNNLSKVAAGLALISAISASEPVFTQSKKENVEVLSFRLGKVFVENDSIQKDIIITGKVKDSFDVLPGVSIVLKESTLGTETDFDGNFSIKIPNKKAKSTILVISYLGYKTQEIDVLSIKKPLIIEMEETNELLGEIVTVGMVTIKRPNIFKRIGNLFRKKENRRY
ncbi:carboxypeptidase-like regulatory domain-containing protein [Polaribacter vadi]|uniref:carboxypeptidase-like regulatory domain-containing protein n=1 Tax=Polaribacter TaxID=52959 RepID=UPI001C0801EF|nr:MULTISPECIES: carboxypeptidase-like regulatory domain-containing protein [Polaribacter]MBU3010426.1 carboxypeptidase-like regulatory domain-containing protein [Polaribacter vadi]MDO6740234.1 carboxypeptidase-like regulatory domain-containing protein [Polaribacter sp. 1_MG-2023]